MLLLILFEINLYNIYYKLIIKYFKYLGNIKIIYLCIIINFIDFIMYNFIIY